MSGSDELVWRSTRVGHCLYVVRIWFGFRLRSHRHKVPQHEAITDNGRTNERDWMPPMRRTETRRQRQTFRAFLDHCRIVVLVVA